MQFDHVAQQVPDIAAAVDHYLEAVPGTTVIYQDETWAFLDAAGAKLAFVMADQHPNHLAWRVDDAELERMAAEQGAEIATHRDRTRSFYIAGPGGMATEVIAYPADAE